MIKSSVFLIVFGISQTFALVDTNVTCNENLLNIAKGPAIYGPRETLPPEHDLPPDPKPEPVHMGVSLKVWHNSLDKFNVGGLAVLANGDLLELDYYKSLSLITGLDSAQKVSRLDLSGPLDAELLGLLLRNNHEVYISTASSIWYYDFDGKKISGGKELLRIKSKSGWYRWNSDLEMDENYLYTMLGSRGEVSRYNFKTGIWEMGYATAMRNSHGMGKDTSGNIWFTDNQGNYRPASPVFLLKQGKNYGVPTEGGTTGASNWQKNLGPAPDLMPYKNDMLWIPYNGMSQSASDIHFMKSGPFKGQALVGDNRSGHLNRLIIEKVDGQYQGAALRMTGGLEAPNYRIVEDSKGNFYLGGMGKPAYWHWCGKEQGFQKMNFKTDFIGNKNFNDIANVSLVSNGLLVSFTSDITDDFLSTSNYKSYMFSYLKSVRPNYGGPKSDSIAMPIQNIIKRSNREIFISIDHLKPESMLALEFGKILTVTNKLQSYELFYTMNHLSTTNPTSIGPLESIPSNEKIDVAVKNLFLTISVPNINNFNFYLVDLMGKNISTPKFEIQGNRIHLDITQLHRGLYFLNVKSGTQKFTKTFFRP